MFTPIERLLLVLATLILGTFALRDGQAYGWLLIAAAALFAIGYWRSATVWRAWRAHFSGDVERFERLLAAVPTPRLLSPRQRAYYEWLRGESAYRQGDPSAARQHLMAALAGRLTSVKDRSFAYSRLADVQLAAGDRGAAREAIVKARALKPSKFVEALLADLEETS
jgi:hypothetical protein